MVTAPTTDSEIAPSMSPTRSRTAPYARPSMGWNQRISTTSGRKQR